MSMAAGMPEERMLFKPATLVRMTAIPTRPYDLGARSTGSVHQQRGRGVAFSKWLHFYF
jgi:hypothetical protein